MKKKILIVAIVGTLFSVNHAYGAISDSLKLQIKNYSDEKKLSEMFDKQMEQADKIFILKYSFFENGKRTKGEIKAYGFKKSGGILEQYFWYSGDKKYYILEEKSTYLNDKLILGGIIMPENRNTRVTYFVCWDWRVSFEERKAYGSTMFRWALNELP